MTIVGLGLWPALACVLVVFVGATVQGSIGTGLGLLAAPILTLVDPDFIPAAMLISVLPLTVGVAVRERGHIDRAGAVRAFSGRIPGTFVGAWIAANAGTTTVALIIGGCVLIAVLVSLTSFRFEPTPRNVLLAGLTSGVTGTATGVGGPPMAITYQHSEPETLRGTLSMFFILGGLLSIATLTWNGVLGMRQLELAGLLIPGVVGGLLLSRVTASRLPADRLRPLVLAACAASALLLLAEQLI